MKAWILFFLGSIAYFLYRFTTRRTKADFDFKFWMKDNWPELLLTFIFDFAAVLILLDPETNIDITKIEWMPSWLFLPFRLVGAFLTGYGGGWAIYSIFKKKVKYKLNEKKPD
jgi:hypothetical protein